MKLVMVAAMLVIVAMIARMPVAPVVVLVHDADDTHTIRVTKDVIMYGGRLVTSTAEARCPDSPCFVVESLVDALRADVTRPREIRISIEDDLTSTGDTGSLQIRLLCSILRAGNDAVVTSL